MLCIFVIIKSKAVMVKEQKLLINITVFLLIYNFYHGFAWCLDGIVGRLTGGYSALVMFALTIFVYFYTYSRKISLFDTNYLRYSLLVWFVYIFTYFVCYLKGSSVTLVSILNVSYLPLLILIRDDIKYEVFKKLLNVVIVFLSLSFVEYLLYTIFHIGVVLSVYVRASESNLESQAQILYELFFNFVRFGDGVPRFQSLCQEPGQLGNLCWILIVLIGQTKTFRIQQILLFLFGATSFSLAFYVIIAIYLISIKVNFKVVASIIVGFCIFYFSFTQAFNTLVLDRIDGKSVEEIDNRTSESFDYYFEQSIADGTIIWGNGGKKSEYMEGNNTGGKVVLYQYGVVCTLAIMAVCLLVYRRFSHIYNVVSNRKAFCLLLIFMGAFYKGGLIMSVSIMFLIIIYPLITYYNLLNQSYNEKL